MTKDKPLQFEDYLGPWNYNELTAAPRPPKFVSSIPSDAGDVIGMCVHKERVYVATQFGVFVLNDDKKLEQLVFVDVLAEPSILR